MPGNHTKADARWSINVDERSGRVSQEDAALAVLMDIRHELKELNQNLLLNTSYVQSVRDEVRQVNQRMLKAGFKARG